MWQSLIEFCLATSKDDVRKERKKSGKHIGLMFIERLEIQGDAPIAKSARFKPPTAPSEAHDSGFRPTAITWRN